MKNPSAFPGKQKALLIKSEHSDIAKEYEIDQNGMTLRDYFAAKAMQTYLADKDLIDMFLYMNADVKEQVALIAYQMADAMLKAREV